VSVMLKNVLATLAVGALLAFGISTAVVASQGPADVSGASVNEYGAR
jgi:hypothetical protein